MKTFPSDGYVYAVVLFSLVLLTFCIGCAQVEVDDKEEDEINQPTNHEEILEALEEAAREKELKQN